MRRPPTLATVLLGVALAAVACGDGTAVPDSGPAPEPTDFPVVVEAANGSVTVTERPKSIISLSPTATESLFAIGAGDQVVAVDEYSTYPAAAPVTDLSGLTPNIEAIMAFEPDLVVVANDIDGIVDALTDLGTPVLLQPAAVELADVYAQIEQLGAVTGRIAEAVRLVTQMQAEVTEITDGLSGSVPGLTYYHELDSTLYTVTSSTFIGRIYATFGLQNIADAVDPDGSGYPQLSAEYVIETDPDIIFLTDCCGENLETVAARPGWSSMTAVDRGAVVVVEDDLASRWGPRVVSYLRSVAAAVNSVAVGA